MTLALRPASLTTHWDHSRVSNLNCILPRAQDKRTAEAGYEARLRKAEEHVSAIAAAAEARSQAKMLAEVERYKVLMIARPASHLIRAQHSSSRVHTRHATLFAWCLHASIVRVADQAVVRSAALHERRRSHCLPGQPSTSTRRRRHSVTRTGFVPHVTRVVSPTGAGKSQGCARCGVGSAHDGHGGQPRAADGGGGRKLRGPTGARAPGAGRCAGVRGDRGGIALWPRSRSIGTTHNISSAM